MATIHFLINITVFHIMTCNLVGGYQCFLMNILPLKTELRKCTHQIQGFHGSVDSYMKHICIF
jgi:hypothetical protein